MSGEGVAEWPCMPAALGLAFFATQQLGRFPSPVYAFFGNWSWLRLAPVERVPEQ